MNFRLGSFILILVSLLSAFALAEVSGEINLTTSNSTDILTGIYGTTHNPYCNSDSTCANADKCAKDWDGFSYNVSYTGWCFPATIKCPNATENAATPDWQESGYSFCNGSVKTYCISGIWYDTDCSESGRVCILGGCYVNGTSGTTTSSDTIILTTTTTTVPQETKLLEVTSSPTDFSLTQGESQIKKITVKNKGKVALSAVAISISGVQSSWFSLSKTEFSTIDVNSSATYVINFTIPGNATVKSYTITASIAASDSTSTSTSFKISVMPSSETIENEIKPLYQDCLNTLEALKTNITQMEQSGINMSDVRLLLDNALNKVNLTAGCLDTGDFFNASLLLQEANNLIGDINLKISEKSVIESGDFTLIIIITVLLVVGGIFAYLFMPEDFRPGFMSTSRFRTKKGPGSQTGKTDQNYSFRSSAYKQKRRTIVDRLAEIKHNIGSLKKEEKKQKKEKLKYEFKR